MMTYSAKIGKYGANEDIEKMSLANSNPYMDPWHTEYDAQMPQMSSLENMIPKNILEVAYETTGMRHNW